MWKTRTNLYEQTKFFTASPFWCFLPEELHIKTCFFFFLSFCFKLKWFYFWCLCINFSHFMQIILALIQLFINNFSMLLIIINPYFFYCFFNPCLVAKFTNFQFIFTHKKKNSKFLLISFECYFNFWITDQKCCVNHKAKENSFFFFPAKLFSTHKKKKVEKSFEWKSEGLFFTFFLFFLFTTKQLNFH